MQTQNLGADYRLMNEAGTTMAWRGTLVAVEGTTAVLNMQCPTPAAFGQTIIIQKRWPVAQLDPVEK